VFETSLIAQLRDKLISIVPSPSAFDVNFVAPNQEPLTGNILKETKKEIFLQLQ
jgi:hypothetical protein